MSYELILSGFAVKLRDRIRTFLERRLSLGNFTESGSATKSMWPRWRLISLLMFVVASGHFNRISMSVAGNGWLIPNLGISPVEMGWVYTAFLLTYTLCMTPGGWCIDRFGPKLALLILLLGSAVFMGFTGLSGLIFSAATSIWIALLIIRSLMGMVNAPLHPGATKLVGNWIPATGQNFVNGLVGFAAIMGIASTYLLFGWLMKKLGWTGAAICAGGGAFVLGFLWLVFARDRPKENAMQADAADAAARTSRGDILLLLANPSLIFLTLSYALVGYFQYLFFYWAEYYFESIRGLSSDTSRLYATIMTLAMGFGMLFGGWLCDALRARFKHKRILAIVPVVGLIFSAVLVIPGILIENPNISLICFVLAMAGVGAGEGTFWTLTVEIGGKRGGTAAAIMNTGGNAGGLIAPVFTPFISKWLGWQAGFGMASVVCVLGALCWLWIDPSKNVADESELD